MSAHRIRTRFYQQFDADFTREVPAEATGGWQSAELPIDWHRTALVVMHAWDCGTLEQFPGVFHPNEYLPRSYAICREIFPPLLAAVRASPMRLFHVVGAGDYYKNHPGYLRAKLLAGEAGDRMDSGATEHIEQGNTIKELLRFRRDHVSPGAHNFDNAMAGRKVRDFPETARPHDNEGIAENGTQLFALCREHRIDHLVYIGFAIDQCLLVSPGGMVDMGRHGLLCSTIPEAVTAVENKETARHELAKALALWRVALGFGFVYDLADFMAGLQSVALAVDKLSAVECDSHSGPVSVPRSKRMESFLPYDALLERMEYLSRTYPGVFLEFYGESRDGRKLPWLRVAGGENSALLLISTLHATELAGGVVLLSALEAFLRRRGSAAREHPAIYLVPRVAVDGAELVIATGQRLRSAAVPATGSEIEPEDLDGDGLILQMRWPDPNGLFFVPDEDPRMLVVHDESITIPGKRYHCYHEGRMADASAQAPSFPPVGPDFNRVFTSADAINAQPETAALASFIRAHPEIAAALDFHTGNPAVFYPGSWVGKAMDSAEHRLGRAIGAAYEMPYVSEYQELFSKVPEKKLAGYFTDWLDAQCGIPCCIVELGLYYNHYGVDLIRHPETLASSFALDWYWQKTLLEDAETHRLNGVFVPWRTFDHPQFGRVEIGGWDRLPWSNPVPQEWPKLTESTLKAMEILFQWMTRNEAAPS